MKRLKRGDVNDKALFVSACQFIGLLNQNKEEWLNSKISKVSVSEEEILKKIDERNKAREKKKIMKKLIKLEMSFWIKVFQ